MTSISTLAVAHDYKYSEVGIPLGQTVGKCLALEYLFVALLVKVERAVEAERDTYE